MTLSPRAPVMQASFRSLLLTMLAVSLGVAALMGMQSHNASARWVFGLSVVDAAAFGVLLFVNIRCGR